MTTGRPRELRMVPIDRIDVLNPRERSQANFARIAENIQAIGLKKPITVSPRPGNDGAERYLLVCGEGRLKVFRDLGESRIPALIVHVNDEDAFLMGLTENIARRKYPPMELLQGIKQLKERGDSVDLIAQKTGLSPLYVTEIALLIDQGEERLLIAVHQGRISLSAARDIVIAGDDDKALQAALQDAYEAGTLRGRQLMEARRLIRKRQLLGRTISRGLKRKRSEVTTTSLVNAYRKEVVRQQVMVRRATVAQGRLLFIAGALRRLIADDNFTNLLRAEGLDSLPKYLGDRIVHAHTLP